MRDTEDARTLCDLLEGSVRHHGARPLFLRKVSGRWQPLSYAEFGVLVAHLRAGLAALGVTRGDRVAIIASNSVEWAAVAYASYGLGAAIVPMYESQRESDWQFIVRDSGAKVLFVSTPAIFAKVSGLSASAPKLRHVACLAGSYAAILEDGRRRPPVAAQPTSSDVAAILYTSGTTGQPKGVVLTHGNVLSNVLGLRAMIRETIARPERHRSLSFLPWAHAFGHTVELHALLASGACMAIAEGVDKIVDNIREVRPTVLVAVPTVFLRIHAGLTRLMAEKSRFVRWLFEHGLARARRRLRGERPSWSQWALSWLADALVFSRIRARFGGRLRFAICGAAALPREAAELMEAIGVEVYEGYGLTETSPIATANAPGRRRPGSVGQALAGVRVEIDPRAGTEPGRGEIVVHGPNVMQGYHGREEETQRVLTAEGGLRTGDLGYVDAEGYLFVTGRIKEQYKLSNGKYVAPAPLEDRLKLSPLIENVMVWGDNKPYCVALIAPDEAALGRLAAELGLPTRECARLLEEPAIRRRYEQELASLSAEHRSYERVRAFAFMPEVPSQHNGLLTPSFKLKRAELVRRFGGLLDELYPDPRAEPSDTEPRDALIS